MSILNTRNGYGLIPKILHWVIVVLLTLSLIGGLTGMVYDKQVPHEILGKVILTLAVVRLILRFMAPAPAPHPNHAKWEINLAHVTHWGLYLVLFIYPLSGWMMVSVDPTWGQTGNLPFIPQSWEGALAVLHHNMKVVLAILLLLHLGGAAKHTILDRDSTMQRMWFGKSS